MTRLRFFFGFLLLAGLCACSRAPGTLPAPPLASTATRLPEVPSAPLPTATRTAIPIPPRVENRTPAGPALTERSPEIRLTFSRAMDPKSVAAALRIAPPAPYSLRWDGPDLYITIGQPLMPGDTYKFTLSRTARDLDGFPLLNDYRWAYALEPLLASATWPTQIRPGQPISCRFNYTVDTAAMEAAFSLHPAGDDAGAVPGTYGWDAAGQQLTFIPHDPLPPGTDYVIAFGRPLVDADGNDLPPLDPITFTSPSPILAVSPPAGSWAASPLTPIRITFDRPMDRAATAAAVRIDPPVEGVIDWEETTLSFTPHDGHLQGWTEYTVTLAETAAGANGEPILARPYTWQFSTDELPRVASFGEYGANAQVLDAAGRRAIQFLLLGKENEPAQTLTFELYRLTVEQFLDRYSSSFRGVAGWQKTPISLAGTELAETWQGDFEHGEFGSLQEVLIPPDVPPGLYILNLRHEYTNDQLLLLLTRNTIMVKQAERQIVAWVTDINGGNVPGIEVGVYARNGQLVRQGRTNGNGVYRATVARDPQPLIVIARQGNDITAAGLSNEWRSPRGYWWGWWTPAPEGADFMAYVYTDRPIYRPGQTVFYKAVIRKDDDANLSLYQPGTLVTVRIRDARNNVVQTEVLELNNFGTVHGAFQIADGAMLGAYAVEVEIDGLSQRQIFKVQDYRKPDIQLSVSADAEAYVTGETIQVSVSAQYFYGEPVPHADLEIRQYLLAREYAWWDPQAEAEYTWYPSGIEAHEATADEEGRYTFTLPAVLSQQHEDAFNYRYHWGSSLQQTTWGIEVTVDDGSNQAVSGFTTVKVNNAAEEIDLDTRGYWKTPGDPFTIQARVQDLDGGPVAGRDIALQLRQWQQNQHDYTRVVQTIDLTTNQSGEGTVQLSVDAPGYYQVYLTGSDLLGNPIQHKRGLYVFSEASLWFNDQASELSIAADKDTYRPGETARLMIESPFSGSALLTFERGSTRREQVIQLTAPMTVVETRIRADDAPNIFVTVNAWEERDTSLSETTYENLPDSRLHLASLELHVPVTDKVLTVAISPDQDVYAPRADATYQIQVTDARGQPVQAEVSLALVDEAIFSLSEELSGPMVDAFYAERDHLVRTFDAMALRRELWGGGRGGGGDESLAGNPRSDFPDTAIWLPALTTDRDGRLEVTFPLPDTLTSWRLTVKATTGADTRVGEASINVLTQQPVVVRPLLPRILTVGDQVLLSAMVHNYSGARLDLDVSIEASGLEIGGPLIQQVSLEAGEQQILGWAATAATAGDAEIIIRAFAGPTDDAIQLAIPIQPLAIPEITTQVGEFEGTFTTEIQWPENALAISSLQIELNRTIAGSLLTGLEYLTGFPYGCVEQTMSFALPNAVVGRAFHQLGVGNPSLQADLPPKINAGLQKLYGYQHNDGGWGWWFDDDTDAYQTAWVVFGLAVTREAGYEVDEQVIARGVDWLAIHLAEMDIRTQAYALYSMAVAGYGDLDQTAAMLRRLGELDTFSQAALALALNELGETDGARQVIDDLVKLAVRAAGKAYWPGESEDGYYDRKTMASTTRTTALALSALLRVQPGHPLEPEAVRWLMGQRRQQGWGSTNETSYAILALTDHLLATELASLESDYAVNLNGTAVSSGTLGRGEPAVTLTIPAEGMLAGPNQLRLEQSGPGRLYYVINSRIFIPEARIDPAGVVQVSRDYLDPDTDQPLDAVSPGDLVKVRLSVRLASPGSYMIIEDHLPGGLEALNEGLNTVSHVTSVQDEPYYYWREYGYNQKEIFGDRVTFFVTEMEAGMRTFTYFARAIQEGSFTALPAEAAAMYDAQTWGRSGSATFTVSDDPP